MCTDEDTGEAELQPIAAGTAGDQRLRHVRGFGRRRLDLHAQQQPCRRAGAAGGRRRCSDTITVTSEDGTDSQVITITITGTNGAATITGDVSGGVTEDGVAEVSGNLDVADEDTGEAELQPIAAGTAGDQRLRHLRGFWPTAPGPTRSTTADPAVQALPAGETLQRHHHGDVGRRHRHAKRSPSPSPAPTARLRSRGDVSGAVTEDGVQTVSGDLDVTDEDTGEAELQPIAAGTRRRQWLRHVRGSGRRRLDLHAQQQRSRGAGAACGRDAAGHHHGDVGRRHRHRSDHHHHHRHQRAG